MTIFTENLNEARKISPGIAKWIDDQRAKGRIDVDIHAELRAVSWLVENQHATLSGGDQ